MYQRVNIRGMIAGGLLIVVALARALNAGGLAGIFREVIFYIGAALVVYNAIRPTKRST